MIDIDYYRLYQLLVYQLTMSGVSGIVLKCIMGPLLLLSIMRVHKKLAQDSQGHDLLFALTLGM